MVALFAAPLAGAEWSVPSNHLAARAVTISSRADDRFHVAVAKKGDDSAARNVISRPKAHMMSLFSERTDVCS